MLYVNLYFQEKSGKWYIGIPSYSKGDCDLCKCKSVVAFRLAVVPYVGEIMALPDLDQRDKALD